MNKFAVILVVALFGSLIYFAPDQQRLQPEDIQALSLTPKPASVTELNGPAVTISASWDVSGDETAVAAFLDLMQRTAGITFAADVGSKNKITFNKVSRVEGPESYRLKAEQKAITIEAEDDAGLFYGAVTLWQMIVPGMDKGYVHIRPVEITDKPRFGWRGIMLDEARHFMGEEFVRNLIDWMSLHKFNIFQWHLVDDQGWRIEINAYPELTSNGAWRVPAGDGAIADIDPATGTSRKIGGFYTQDQIKSVVEYAASKHITIVPEIGLPGHAQVAVATYPERGVTGEEMPVSSDWGIFEYTYNLEEETFTYLETILLEVMALFPSEYIHLGGDEVQKKQWAADARTQERMAELGIESVEGIQPYFTRHFDKFLASHGRKMIGWDEILEGGEIHKTATVMSWRGEAGGIEAAHKGHTVVMSPWPVMYLDMHQSLSEREPTGRPARSSLGPIEDVYNYEPVPADLIGNGEEYVLGAQGNIWTEHMRTTDMVMHMTFPRAAAIAEAVWSPKEKDFGDFVRRLPAQFSRYDILGVKYADVAFEVLADVKVGGDTRTVKLSNQVGTGDIRYTLDGSDVTLASPLYTEALSITADQILKAVSFMDGRAMTAPTVKMMDRVSLSTRTDDTMEVCDPGYHLKLDDDWPRTDVREAFAMNIIDPCWIYREPDLEGIATIRIDVGQVPFNFQIGDDWKKVRFDTPKSEHGELNIYAGTCGDEPIMSLSLEAANGNHGITTLEAAVPEILIGKDICFRFGLPPLVDGGQTQNLWGVNKVTLH